MTKSKAFIAGIIGVLLFVLTTMIAGFLYPNYNSTAQFISELYAVNAPNADVIRYCFYIPSGIVLFLFAVFAIQETPKSTLKTLGFLGVGFGYGLSTVICSIFNCDIGCNPDFVNPSLNQIIHNFVGFLTYLIVPFSILFVAIASKKWKNNVFFSNSSFVAAFISFIFFMVLNTSLESAYKGLIQRIIEGGILIWIVLCSFYILKNKKDVINQ